MCALFCRSLLLFLIMWVPLFAGEAKLVLIGEQELEVSVRGMGNQTVVFESGLGHGLSVWEDVANEISPYARVVSYSRAGNGNSEASSEPRTLQRVATELNRLLVAQNVTPPYILVGHSAGGFYIRKFAELYPEKVQGFVFVDATPAKILIGLRQLDDLRAREEEAVIESMTPDRVKPEDLYFSKITSSGVYPATGSLPDVPAVMITAMKREHPQFLLHSVEGKRLWRELQSDFIGQFSDNLHIISSVSGHDVHRQQPELVTGAIRYVMRQAVVASAGGESLNGQTEH